MNIFITWRINWYGGFLPDILAGLNQAEEIKKLNQEVAMINSEWSALALANGGSVIDSNGIITVSAHCIGDMTKIIGKANQILDDKGYITVGAGLHLNEANRAGNHAQKTGKSIVLYDDSIRIECQPMTKSFLDTDKLGGGSLSDIDELERKFAEHAEIHRKNSLDTVESNVKKQKDYELRQRIFKILQKVVEQKDTLKSIKAKHPELHGTISNVLGALMLALKESGLAKSKIKEAAFQSKSGEIIATGPLHNAELLPKDFEISTEGFLDDSGSYITREEASKMIGINNIQSADLDLNKRELDHAKILESLKAIKLPMPESQPKFNQPSWPIGTIMDMGPSGTNQNAGRIKVSKPDGGTKWAKIKSGILTMGPEGQPAAVQGNQPEKKKH